MLPCLTRSIGARECWHLCGALLFSFMLFSFFVLRAQFFLRSQRALTKKNFFFSSLKPSSEVGVTTKHSSKSNRTTSYRGLQNIKLSNVVFCRERTNRTRGNSPGHFPKRICSLRHSSPYLELLEVLYTIHTCTRNLCELCTPVPHYYPELLEVL